jgi:hypothetical protein
MILWNKVIPRSGALGPADVGPEYRLRVFRVGALILIFALSIVGGIYARGQGWIDVADILIDFVKTIGGACIGLLVGERTGQK